MEKEELNRYLKLKKKIDNYERLNKNDMIFIKNFLHKRDADLLFKMSKTMDNHSNYLLNRTEDDTLFSAQKDYTHSKKISDAIEEYSKSTKESKEILDKISKSNKLIPRLFATLKRN